MKLATLKRPKKIPVWQYKVNISGHDLKWTFNKN